MNEISVIHQPSESELNKLGVRQWPIWTKEASSFPWQYDDSETCFFLEGEVVVTPEDSEPVAMGKGDLVTFPKGMACHWEIKQDVKKHYNFG